MPDYLAPGVYVEEYDSTPSIEGVSTSIAGFVGATQRGPVGGLPVLVTSLLDFQRQFGGPFDFGPNWLGVDELPYGVAGFFANQGQLLYVTRVAHNDAAAASGQLLGGLVTRLKPGADAAAGSKVIKPATLRGMADGVGIVLTMTVNGVTYTSNAVTIDGGGVNRDTGEVTLNAALTITPAGTQNAFLASATAVTTNIGGLDANGVAQLNALPRPNSFTMTAHDVGSWGGSINVQSGATAGARGEYAASLAAANNASQVQLKSAAGFYANAWVEIDRGSANKFYRQVNTVAGNVITLQGPAVADADLKPVAPATTTVFTVCEFNLSASWGIVSEKYTGLTLAQVPGKYVVDIVNGNSNLLQISGVPADTNPFNFPSGADGLTLTFTVAGSDGTVPTALDIVGTDGGPGHRTGLKALEDIEQISIIGAPGWGDINVQNAMIEQCERLKYRLAILDPRPKAGDQAPSMNDVIAQRLQYDTKYAAIYYPRVLITDVNGSFRAVGPSPFMAGIYARVDNTRGVFKAPANEVIDGIVDYEVILNKADQEILNPEPNNINVLRDFRGDGRGLRVYGARCITSINEWKYVPVRRLFIFLEHSLDRGLQPAVMEPNGPALWAQLIDSVSNFLTGVWLDGALVGAKKEDAFFVHCGLGTSMTQDDLDNGRLIVLIGVAAVKPAEFVVIRIGQWAGGSSVSES
jgi:phage tail sheath protein FI